MSCNETLLSSPSADLMTYLQLPEVVQAMTNDGTWSQFAAQSVTWQTLVVWAGSITTSQNSPAQGTIGHLR